MSKKKKIAGQIGRIEPFVLGRMMMTVIIDYNESKRVKKGDRISITVVEDHEPAGRNSN